MDRSELEGLIARTLQKPANAPLSPKQQFQSQIRGLTAQPRHAPAPSEPGAASASRHHELRHVSTLRVQRNRNASALPPRGRVALSETSNNPHHSQTAAYTGNAGPDFSVEEQDAWTKQSPGTTSTSIPPRGGHRVSYPLRQQAIKPYPPPVFPPPERLEPFPQPRKQARQPSLRQFEPLPMAADLDRPKTSRGLPTQSPAVAEPRTNKMEQEAEAQHQSNLHGSSKIDRRSKFLEGSMNDRSVAVASSWYHDSTSGSEGVDEPHAFLANETDTDSDATPRASNQRPPAPAPPTTRKSMFRFGGGRRSDESARTVEEAPKHAKERKGLRKNISIWNFREKIFGGSGSDANSETSTQTTSEKREGAQKDKKTGAVADIDILNERKRKAEEAYAQQFGVKKQKSNIGQPVASTPANEAVVEEKRPKTPTLFRRKRDQRTPSDHKRAAEALDAHKRLSRKELEKENQQLRTLLRETQSVTFSRSASWSSIDLAATNHENFVRAPLVTLSPGKKQGRWGEDIPPVPKLPNQEVLAELQNRARPLRPEMEADKENQGFFETIDEGAEMEDGKGRVSMQRQWEWPDDVF
jgi:hypothetical protein